MKKHPMKSLIVFSCALAVASALMMARPFNNASSGFTLSGSPFSESVWPLGPSAHYTVTVTSVNDFAGTVSLACRANSPHLSCTISPSSIVVGGELPTRQVTVRADTDGAVRPGTYEILISGESGAITSSTVVQLVVI